MKPASLLKSTVANLVVPAAIAVGLFLALEGGCRLAGRARSGVWPRTRAEAYTEFVRKVGKAYRLHPLLVVTGRPDAVLEVAGKRVVFNARGQRGTNVLNLPMPKPPGRFRIVCAGGSTTFDLLAENNEATWAARLGRALETRNVDVANAGFPGWTSLESLLSLEIRDLELGPDLVVLYSGVNDLQPAGHEPFASDYSAGHFEILPRVTGAAPVPVRLVSRSIVLESLLDRLRPGRPEGVEGFAPAYAWTGGPKKDDIPAAAVAVYERNLLSTIGVASAHGAKVVLVPQVLRVRRGHEARDTEWIEGWCPGLTVAGARRGLERYNDVMRKLARDGRALLVEPFPDAAPADEEFADPCHFSPEGSERFASRLADVVSKTLLEGRSR